MPFAKEVELVVQTRGAVVVSKCPFVTRSSFTTCDVPVASIKRLFFLWWGHLVQQGNRSPKPDWGPLDVMKKASLRERSSHGSL